MDDFPTNPFAPSSLNEQKGAHQRHHHDGEKLNREGFLVVEPEEDDVTLELVDEDGFLVPPDPIELDHIFERVERVRSNTKADFMLFPEDVNDKMEEGNDDTVQADNSDDLLKEKDISKNMDDDDDNRKEHQDSKLNRASVIQVFQFGRGPKKWWGLLLGLLCAAISGCIYPVMAFVLSNTFRVLSVPTSDEFREDIKQMAFIFMILGVVGAVSVTTQITLLETAAEEVR